MAISKSKKHNLVADLTELLSNAKMVAFAKYQGLSVSDLEELRKIARENGVKIKVTKNRLMKVAMNEIAVYQDTDTSGLTGQLLYAISSEDEVMPAKILADFAKTHKALAITGGFNDTGLALAETEVEALASLPTKNELIAQVVAQLLSPATDSLSGLSGGLSGIISGLEQKAA